MMVITLGGIKGGSGKSTVAVHLAVLRANAGRDVLLVDADGQGTATLFAVARAESAAGNAGYTTIQLAGRAVRTEILRLVAKYDDVVIDTAGRDSTSQRAALSVSDVLLVPMVPRSADVWTLEQVAGLVDEIREAVNPHLVALAFLNRADPRGTDNAAAEALIEETPPLKLLPVRLGNRKVFGDAVGEGRAVTEIRPLNARAQEEIHTLCRQLEKFDGNQEEAGD